MNEVPSRAKTGEVKRRGGENQIEDEIGIVDRYKSKSETLREKVEMMEEKRSSVNAAAFIIRFDEMSPNGERRN